MTFPALQEPAATAIIAHLVRPCTFEDNVRFLLRRCHAACAAQLPPAPASHRAVKPRLPWFVSFFAETMRTALRARAAAAAAGAAGAA